MLAAAWPAILLDGVLPLLLVLGAIEWVLYRRRAGAAYDWRASLASVGVAAGHRLGVSIGLLALRPLFETLWAHRLATVPLDRPWALASLFLGVELAYYWQHRLSHRIRWLWASHAVHHTSEQMTVPAAYRLAWTDLVSGTPLFLCPLVVLGFAPAAVLVTVGFVVAYQLWLHTELVPRLGWFDRVFNTPSNHRVHHAANARYGGRNFGGVLVVFDRLFGTYAAELPGIRLRYGLAVPMRSHAPLVIAFHEWAALGRAVRRSRSLAEAIGACFGPPEPGAADGRRGRLAGWSIPSLIPAGPAGGEPGSRSQLRSRHARRRLTRLARHQSR
jgi:sterol desaturase/sphingolipid hydroxylase (fatty acid hydroxylase superfamily)